MYFSKCGIWDDLVLQGSNAFESLNKVEERRYDSSMSAQNQIKFGLHVADKLGLIPPPPLPRKFGPGKYVESPISLNVVWPISAGVDADGSIRRRLTWVTQ